MVFPHIGPMEGDLILLVILMIFGMGKLPQVSGALGKAIREFRKGHSAEAESQPETKKLVRRSKKA